MAATPSEPEAGAPEAGVAASEAVEPEPTGAHVTVTYPGGSRVYSKEVHGADYKSLAKEFAEKHGGKVA